MNPWRPRAMFEEFPRNCNFITMTEFHFITWFQTKIYLYHEIRKCMWVEYFLHRGPNQCCFLKPDLLRKIEVNLESQSCILGIKTSYLQIVFAISPTLYLVPYRFSIASIVFLPTFNYDQENNLYFHLFFSFQNHFSLSSYQVIVVWRFSTSITLRLYWIKISLNINRGNY